MRNYIIRRLLLLVPIMLGVSFLTFAMFRIIPGDAAVLICGFGCTDEVVEEIRQDRASIGPGTSSTATGSGASCRAISASP